MTIFVDVLLWMIALALAVVAGMRGGRTFVRSSAHEAVIDFLRLMPRIMIGVIGAGFIAALLPQDVVGRWLGADSGMLGFAIAMAGGAFTPGGPVIGFSIGVAALKGGAGTPQVIAYITAWALFSVQRLFFWELGVMPPRLIWLRMTASLPIPILAALGAMLLGKP
jgi:hypothetical protein